MKAKYSEEYLYHNLPDYISGNIEDKRLITEIEKEIQNNPEFKIEVNKIGNTLNFLNSVELESPHENYFNNLSVKINEKIYKKNNSESIWERLGLFWKILIPVIPLVITAILLFNFLKNEQREYRIAYNDVKQVEPTKESNNNENKESLLLQKEVELKSKNQKLFVRDIKQKSLVNKKIKPTEKTIPVKNIDNYSVTDEITETTSEEDEVLANLMAENIDNQDNPNIELEEDILFPGNDGDNFEDEFLEFTPEEQKEILENLNKSQI